MVLVVLVVGGEGLGKGWGCRNPFWNVPSESWCVERKRWLLPVQPDEFNFVLICNKVEEEKRRAWSLASHHLPVAGWGGLDLLNMKPHFKAPIEHQHLQTLSRRLLCGSALSGRLGLSASFRGENLDFFSFY